MRFMRDEEDRGLGDVYGSYNVANITKVHCPSCGQIVLVPRGHLDAVHDCTIMCPYDSVRMKPITDPANTDVPIGPRSKGELIMEDHLRFYFYYCPSRTCPYFVQHGAGYMQRRVQTEIWVGR